MRDRVALGSLLLVCAWATPTATAAGDDRDRLLERHRPILRYDASETHFAQPVSLPPPSAEVRPGHRVYGRVVRRDHSTWLQYWLFYAYNSQDRNPFATGRHEGDWELIQLRLDARRRAAFAALSQHSWVEGCAWHELERERTGDGIAPVVYVANGSHANYSRAGNYDRPFPDPTDEADGDGLHVRPRVVPIGARHPGWVRYPGRWGESEAGIVPGEMSSPHGPRFQGSDAWSDPAGYVGRARACGSGPPGRPLQTAATIAVAVVFAAAMLWLIRRRRA